MADAQDQGVLTKMDVNGANTADDGGPTEFEFQKSGDKISVRLKGSERWVNDVLDQVVPRLESTKFAPTPAMLVHADDDPDDSDDVVISAEARKLLQQSNVDLETLQRVYHFENGSIAVIAPELPGTSNRQKTANAYLLQGFGEFLRSGSPKFSDKDARQLCLHYGTYDSPNHANSLKELKQEMIGSKGEGWTLTMPGRIRALKVAIEAAGLQIQ
jgi:hypothetical protein